MTSDPPFDPGLQPERTLLAWRRTALAVAVGSVFGARLAFPVLGSVGVLIGLLGAVAALVAYTTASVRYRRSHQALVAGRPLPGDAAPLAALATASVLIGMAAFAYVLLLSFGRFLQ
ncbi:DUF202 domain-containing protein [Planctomonas psychrotolerans]|uniref:DUF202 domain-containing protein n=1 Tax=Planctomonas psychrotolerans TaxID=2528712 RepID=UPI001238917F|nr:DUF202 domain-containing protein [Planctomonas psychrotolerans]